MRELDDRLGLTPKGMAALRWNIVPDSPAADGGQEDDTTAREGVTDMRAARRRRMTDAS